MEAHTHAPLFPLVLVSVLAFLIPILTSWFSQRTKLPIPTIVGEIICGIIIGKSFLGLIDNTETYQWLDFLSLFGFTYLMFLSGLEVDVSLLATNNENGEEKQKAFDRPIVLGLSHFVLTLVLSSAISIILYSQGVIQNWLMMTLILSTTSVSIVVPVLKERALSKTVLGQTILLSALAADFITMVLITLLVAFSKSGEPSYNVLLFILLLGLAIFAHRMHISKGFDKLISKFYILKPILNELAHTTTQIKVRGAIALMIIFIVASQAMGFEVILGAFLAGILTTLILGEDKTDQLEMKLDAIGYGFFIPIFFLSVGINLDLRVFFASEKAWLLLIFLLFSAFLIKILPSLIFALKFKLKDAFSAGVLLSARLSLIIAASTIGLKEGMISEEVNAAIVMVAVMSCTIAPIIFNRIAENGQKTVKEYSTIIGANPLSRILAENLIEHSDKVKLVAMSGEEYYSTKKCGLPVIKKSFSIEKTLLKTEISNTKALVLTTEDDKFNLKVAKKARNSYGITNIIAIVHNVDYIDAFKEQGVEIVSKLNTIADKLTSKALFPQSEYLATIGEDEINIADVTVLNPVFDGLMVRDFCLPGETAIVLIKRGDESIIPHDDTYVNMNDHLTLVGDYDDVKNSINIISTPAKKR